MACHGHRCSQNNPKIIRLGVMVSSIERQNGARDKRNIPCVDRVSRNKNTTNVSEPLTAYGGVIFITPPSGYGFTGWGLATWGLSNTILTCNPPRTPQERMRSQVSQPAASECNTSNDGVESDNASLKATTKALLCDMMSEKTAPRRCLTAKGHQAPCRPMLGGHLSSCYVNAGA